jgi:bis(5'-nucleosidyl)-tetraphosphatase
MVEKNEDPWEAAVREVQEETGLTHLCTPFGKTFIETEPYGKGKVARYYVVLVEDEKEVTLIANPQTGIIEHHEFRWVTIEDARRMLVPRVANVLGWAKQQIPD